MNTLATIFKTSYLNILHNVEDSIANYSSSGALIPDNNVLGLKTVNNKRGYYDNRPSSAQNRVIINEDSDDFKQHLVLGAHKNYRVSIDWREPTVETTMSTAERYLLPAIYMTTYQTAHDALYPEETEGYTLSNKETYVSKRMFDYARRLTSQEHMTISMDSEGVEKRTTDVFVAHSKYSCTVGYASTPEDKYDEWTDPDKYLSPSDFPTCCGGHIAYTSPRYEQRPVATGEIDDFGNIIYTNQPVHVGEWYHYKHRHYSHTEVNYIATMSIEYGINTNPELEDNIRAEYKLSEADGFTAEDLDNVAANKESMLRIYMGSAGLIDLGMGFISPIRASDAHKVRISSHYGETDDVWHIEPHEGTDFAKVNSSYNVTGLDCLAICDAKVLKIGWMNSNNHSDGFGYRVVLQPVTENGTPIQYEGKDIQIYYGHCLAEHGLNIRAGQIVRKGDVVAKIGNTGNSSGPHLHLEIRLVSSNGSWQTVNPEGTISGLPQ
jgi:murein DD-endopeptidase MepM/ murein hydrolase activator NlpD